MTDCCLCVCLRPATYRRLIDDTYPKNTTGYEGNLVPVKLSRLCDYAAQFPRKLPSIGRYLERRIVRDFRKAKYGYVHIGLEDFKQLVETCHKQATTDLIEPHLANVVSTLLQTSEPQSVSLALRAFMNYATICEDSAEVTPYVKPIIANAQDYTSRGTPIDLLTLSLDALLKLIEVLISTNPAQLELKMRSIMDVVVKNMRGAPATGAKDDAEHSILSGLARECIIYTATVSAPSTLLKLLGTLFEIFDSQQWDDLDFITDVLEVIATSSESVNAYHLPTFHHLLGHLGKQLQEVALRNDVALSVDPSTDPKLKATCHVCKRILDVTVRIIKNPPGELTLHSLFEEDLQNLLSLVLFCVLKGKHPVSADSSRNSTKKKKVETSPSEWEEIAVLIDSVFVCVEALSQHLPASVDRVEMLNIMMKFLESREGQYDRAVEQRLTYLVLKAELTVLTHSADVFGEDKICTNYFMYRLAGLLQQTHDPNVGCMIKDVCIDILRWKETYANTHSYTQIVPAYADLKDPQFWRPLSFSQCEHLRGGLFLALLSATAPLRAEVIVRVSAVMNALLRAFNVRDLLAHIPLFLKLRSNWMRLDVDNATGEQELDLVDTITSHRFLVLVYFRTAADVFGAVELRNVTDNIMENWKRYGAIPSCITVEKDKPTELKMIATKRVNNPPVMKSGHDSFGMVMNVSKESMLPPLLQCPRLADHALLIRQAFDTVYEPPMDLRALLTEDVFSPRLNPNLTPCPIPTPNPDQEPLSQQQQQPLHSHLPAPERISSANQESFQAFMKSLELTEVPDISMGRRSSAVAYDPKMKIPIV